MEGTSSSQSQAGSSSQAQGRRGHGLSSSSAQPQAGSSSSQPQAGFDPQANVQPGSFGMYLFSSLPPFPYLCIYAEVREGPSPGPDQRDSPRRGLEDQKTDFFA